MPNEKSAPLVADELLHGIVAEVMNITEVRPATERNGDGRRFLGHLTREPQAAYAYLAQQFRFLDYTPLLQQEGREVAVLALPGQIGASKSRLWVALLLFALTLASTTFVGGFTEQGFNLGLGFAFSTALLSILLAHELGHFLMARHLGVEVSYPFFIPLPISPIGTMGAFIALKSPPPNRQALLAIALTGPLAGLALALPILVGGLLLSPVQKFEPPFLREGNSLLYLLLKWAIFGRLLPNAGLDVNLHPVAFAGWVGLLVTGLNLIPAGQLDGGHIFFALVGPRIARFMTWSLAAILFALGFFWNGWFVWALLLLAFGQQRVPLLNELPPLKRGQKVLAVLGLILFVLLFTPTPLKFVQAS